VGKGELAVQIEGKPDLPDEQSEETFITEHYWGYVSQRDGSTLEYQVDTRVGRSGV